MWEAWASSSLVLYLMCPCVLHVSISAQQERSLSVAWCSTKAAVQKGHLPMSWTLLVAAVSLLVVFKTWSSSRGIIAAVASPGCVGAAPSRVGGHLLG